MCARAFRSVTLDLLYSGHAKNRLISSSRPAGAQAIIKVSGHQHRWLAGGYDLEIGQLQRWIPW